MKQKPATTAMADGDGTSTQQPRPARRARLLAASSNSSREIDGDSSSLDSDSDACLSDEYTDLNQGSVSDTSLGIHEDADVAARPRGPGSAVDSETEEIYNSIARFKAEGPAKPNHTEYTMKLWRREGEFWKRFCVKLALRTQLCAETQLRDGNPEVFKAYLTWRKNRSRVRKESSMRSYWKRLSMYYRNLTGHNMDKELLEDVCNWIPTLGLDKTQKEKQAMFVQDLYAVLHALWVDDTTPQHGFIRVQITLLLLLSAATATRPGAIVESASAKGSNRALTFKDVELMKVRHLGDSEKSTIVANITLEHVKNKERDGKPKKFTFRLESLPAFCIVSYILSIGIAQDALRDDFQSVQDIFNLQLPAQRNLLRIKWKENKLAHPFFCDIKSTTDGTHIKQGKAFPYAKYRDTFVRLGRVAGFENSLELYQLRRASGSNINSALNPTERNQTMGHLGSTYEKYYTPTHIARDFQSIYFGSPSEDLLVQAVARMGLSRDRRAPTHLSDRHKEVLYRNPSMVSLREERTRLREELYKQGYATLCEAKGSTLHQNYLETNREIVSTYQRLSRETLDALIRDFHDSVDTLEVARQLSGKAATDVLTLPATDFELPERAAIASIIFKPFPDENARINFPWILARLCQRQETRQSKSLKRGMIEFAKQESGHEESPSLRFRKDDQGLELLSSDSRGSQAVAQHLCGSINSGEKDCNYTFPIILDQPACLICIGNTQFTYERRLRHIPRRDVLNKHLEVHFRSKTYQQPFECRHPRCYAILQDEQHFKRHALDKHGVTH